MTSLARKKYDLIVETAYRIIRNISIDYGVMEKAKDVYVIKGNFGWERCRFVG